MGIFRTKGGWKVKSYTTDRFHRAASGKLRVYKTKRIAERAGGFRWKMRRSPLRGGSIGPAKAIAGRRFRKGR